jgi:hypothetical protein
LVDFLGNGFGTLGTDEHHEQSKYSWKCHVDPRILTANRIIEDAVAS